VATAAIGLLFAGCGSRLPQSTIADAAHRPIVKAAAATTGGQGTAAAAAASSPSSPPAGLPLTATTVPAGVASSGSQAASAAASGAAPSASKSGSTPAATPSAGSVVALGNVGDYSGVLGAIDAGAQQTLQVWAAYTNAHGGLNGHPVHLYTADDGGDPSTSQSLVQQQVTQDHVIAFVGNIVPITVQASLPYLVQQHIPVIGGDITSDYWFQSPVLFPQGTEVLATADGDIRAAVARGDTKLGFLYCVEDPICTQGYNYEITQGHAQADGADPVYSAGVSLTQPDFTAQCLAAKQAGANVLLLGGDANSLERLAANCHAQGYDPLYEALSIGVDAALANDPLVNGMIAAEATFPWMDATTPAQAAYQQAVKQYAPSLAESGSSSAEWTAGMLATAAAQALTSAPTSSEFFQGLWAIKNNTLGGLAPPLTFNANGNATVVTCYFLITLQNGQFTDPDNGSDKC
jgi:branched-chain amino acid transport system substrate-binding protein